MLKFLVISFFSFIGVTAWAANPSDFVQPDVSVADFAVVIIESDDPFLIHSDVPIVVELSDIIPDEQFGVNVPVETVSDFMSLQSVEVVSSSVEENDYECSEWHDLARSVGWEEENIPRLDYVMWRESRCDPSAHNKSDPASGSRGLIQINGYWCRKSQFTNSSGGWLEDQGVLSSCDELFDPEVNLRAGLAIFNYSEQRGCGWGPWTTRNTRWCR